MTFIHLIKIAHDILITRLQRFRNRSQAKISLKGTRLVFKNPKKLPAETTLFLNRIAELTGKGEWTLSILSLAAGKQHIVVKPGKETEFIRALEGLGCILPDLY